MKRSVHSLLILPLLALASCSSDGGPSGGLIGLLSGGTLGALGDHYIGNQSNQGTTTIMNANGTTTTIGPNGQVSNTQAASTTNNIVNTGTGTTGTTTTGTTAATTAGTVAGTGNTIITSNNTGSDVWQNHSGLIVGAASGLAAGAITDSFRQKEIAKKYDEGYAKAKSDAIKEFYWLKRDAQKTMKGGDDPPVQYRYYEVEVPAHTTSDGVLIEKHKRIIEVVE
jgi:hypothetical protein